MGSLSKGVKKGGAASNVAKLSFVSVFLLGINGIVGSGTFLLPQEIYKDAGFLLGMGVILFAGLATTLIAFCYADMAGKFSEGGGAVLLHRVRPVHRLPSGLLHVVRRNRRHRRRSRRPRANFLERCPRPRK